MTDNRKEDARNEETSKGAKKGTTPMKDPEWANGLKQIYDSVLEEPLPDSFKDLLSKLDDGDAE